MAWIQNNGEIKMEQSTSKEFFTIRISFFFYMYANATSFQFWGSLDVSKREEKEEKN